MRIENRHLRVEHMLSKRLCDETPMRFPRVAVRSKQSVRFRRDRVAYVLVVEETLHATAGLVDRL